ncbi:hypothetical protein AJ80_03654 [Polytolypa hystricis UAMH7299]|uniref:Phenylacetyl-CoA ligase n=1 Tax=Polytolypa hystricis (strain UAMH7299) TaxID=1447883 RepID=A0A2B7YFT7_POLH7|nr:hypothetical protein AJ80_03654 [Polytolypa hystricis UAMH7299]
MVRVSPSWVPALPTIPDDIPISEFMLNELYGRHPLGYSRHPFTCGLSGRTYSFLEVADRVDALARGLAEELGWDPTANTEWDKVIGVYSYNSIDYLTLCWAIHRLAGIASPANIAYSADELTYQLKDSGAKALFTCVPSLPIALQAAAKAGIPKNRIYLLDLPTQFTGKVSVPDGFKTLEQLLNRGDALPKLEKLQWEKGEGARRTAFLCYSSGTSGLPKGVMISHKNVIANTIQITTFESTYRDSLIPPGTQSAFTDIILGLLPQSHIYGLVVLAHAGPYRGDQVIILPKFDFVPYLETIQKFKISALYVVPPIIIAMLRQKAICDKFDLSSVQTVFTGAAPLGAETAAGVQTWHPSWKIRQGYGLTETCTVVCSTTPDDIWLGSSGSLLPGYEARIMSADGVELIGYDEPGELVVRSPSNVIGYLNNEKATKETFEDGWMRTGDEAVFRRAPSGNDHIFIVDRIKELIKVKGMQVAPAELEAHLLTHPDVADCSVIQVPDESAGELPKAYVVKSPAAGPDDAATIRSIQKHIEDHKARHKWLKGGVEFIDVIPKSPSGKILRRVLRDKDKEARRKKGAKI